MYFKQTNSMAFDRFEETMKYLEGNENVPLYPRILINLPKLCLKYLGFFGFVSLIQVDLFYYIYSYGKGAYFELVLTGNAKSIFIPVIKDVT